MPTSRITPILTVAAIRKGKKQKGIEYLFNENQRIFTLARTKAAENYIRTLTEALKKRVPVKAWIDERRPIIAKVEPPSERELEEFRKLRTLLEEPDRRVPIDVSAIDPTTFNIVNLHLKFRTFGLCKRIVPNYKTAAAIFDYCAKQSCHLPGPYGVSPCIPFQYVIDGCYARAHKMRWIIRNKFRYCCEKVFSFANQNSDRLAVRANKWGGCCVGWWYHVTPLIRVKVRRLAVLAFVIDPGMFDKPVLLSSWLSAQQNKSCDPNAKVSMFTIQPEGAYTPANYTGTAFSTDPTYALTDATLTAYRNLKTC